MRNCYFDEVSLLWCSRYDYMSGWILKEHSHSHYQIMYIIGGKADVMIHGDLEQVCDHKLIFIKPDELHSIDNIREKGLQTLDVKFDVNSLSLQEKLKDIPSFFTLVDDEFRDILEQIRVEGDEQDYEYIALSSLHLSLLLLKLIRLQYPSKSLLKPSLNYYYRDNLSSRIIKMIAYIEHNVNRNIQAYEFEKQLHCSYRFLSKLSKKEIGITPIELAQHYRILKARELLCLTNFSIKKIALDLGFSNVHNFSRVFKKITGMPPGKFRKYSRNGIRKDIVFDDDFINVINTQF